MSKLLCKCGTQLSDVLWPNKYCGYLLTETQLDADVKDLQGASRHVWECYACGRLGIDFPKAGDATVKWYLPENGKSGELFK